MRHVETTLKHIQLLVEILKLIILPPQGKGFIWTATKL